MYFLAMALYCQYNKHIILSGVDNCTTIHFSFLTVTAAAGFDLRIESTYMQHMDHRFGCINKIIAAVFIILTGTRQRRDGRVERRRVTGFANRCRTAFGTFFSVIFIMRFLLYFLTGTVAINCVCTHKHLKSVNLMASDNKISSCLQKKSDAFLNFTLRHFPSKSYF